MTEKKINKIFRDTAFIRTGGSDEERHAARYIADFCEEATGKAAKFEEFEVQMANMSEAILTVDGKDIQCKGYLCCGSGEVEAELCYLPQRDRYSLSLCKGKIVMIDGGLAYWAYRDIIESGAVGFITHTGNINYSDREIDTKELRAYIANGEKLLGVNINEKDAMSIISNDGKRAKIRVIQEEYVGKSANVVLDLPGEIEDTIIITAHYDSTPLSVGAYDNMSGCIGLMSMAEHFAKTKHRYSLRFVWCGSEERGLLGSKAYCSMHGDELSKIVLNVNLDMIGCTMGKFIACCSSEESAVHYIKYMGYELGFQIKAYQDVYSSDSTPFADSGVPAITFARSAPIGNATIHNSYDTMKVMKAKQMQIDIGFITAFIERMACSVLCPVAREIPANVKEKLDKYLFRKK